MEILFRQNALDDAFSEDDSDPLGDLKIFVDRLDNQTDFQLEQFKGLFDDDSDDDCEWNDKSDFQKVSSDFLSYAKGNENIVSKTNAQGNENKVSTPPKAMVTRSRSNSLKTPRRSNGLKTQKNILIPRDKNVFDFQYESVGTNHVLKEIKNDFETIEYSLSDMLDAILADDWKVEPMVENADESSPEDFPKTNQNVKLIDIVGVNIPQPCSNKQLSDSGTVKISLKAECETSIVEMEEIQTESRKPEQRDTAFTKVQGRQGKDSIERFYFDERTVSIDVYPEKKFVSEIVGQHKTLVYSKKFESELTLDETVSTTSPVDIQENIIDDRFCLSEETQIDSASTLNETVSTSSPVEKPENIMGIKACLSKETQIESESLLEDTIPSACPSYKPENVEEVKALIDENPAFDESSDSEISLTESSNNVKKSELHDGNKPDAILTIVQEGLIDEALNFHNAPFRTDPYDWAYVVWRAKGLMGRVKGVGQTPAKKQTGAKKTIPECSSTHEPKVFVVGPQVLETQTVPVTTTGRDRAGKWNQDACGRFGNLIQQWKQKSDTAPVPCLFSPSHSVRSKNKSSSDVKRHPKVTSDGDANLECERNFKFDIDIENNEQAAAQNADLDSKIVSSDVATASIGDESINEMVAIISKTDDSTSINRDVKRDPKVTSNGDVNLECERSVTFDADIETNAQAAIRNTDLDAKTITRDVATVSIGVENINEMVSIISTTDESIANKNDMLVGMTIFDVSGSQSISNLFQRYLTIDEGNIEDTHDESDDDLEGLADPSQIANKDHEQECACSSSAFSGNDVLEEFFLPQLGMACTCGSTDASPRLRGSDATSLEHILRPWQVAFCKSFGIHKGDQLVKAHHRSASILAKAMRKWRKVHGMAKVRTVSCGVALDIWARSCKYFVRSVRMQRSQGIRMIKPPSTLDLLSELAHKKEMRVSVPASEHGFMTSWERASLGGDAESEVEI